MAESESCEVSVRDTFLIFQPGTRVSVGLSVLSPKCISELRLGRIQRGGSGGDRLHLCKGAYPPTKQAFCAEQAAGK